MRRTAQQHQGSSSHRHHGKGGSLKRLIAIGAFSVGLLGGYIFLSGHPAERTATYRRNLVVNHVDRDEGPKITGMVGVKGTTAGQSHTGTKQQTILRNGAPLSLMQQAAAPQNQLSKTDARHPSNVQRMIEQASHQDEHKAQVLEELRQGQGGEAADAQQSADEGASTAAAGTGAAADTAGAASTTAASTSPPGSKHDQAQAAAGANTTTSSTEADGTTAAADASAVKTTTVSASTEHGEVGSSVASSVARLEQGAEKLKEATKVLAKKKEELEKAAEVAEQEAKQEATAGQATQEASEQAGAQTTTNDKEPEKVDGLMSKGGRPYVAKPKGDTLMEKMFAEKRLGPGDTIQTLFTSNGSPYQNIQARIMVATWRLMQKMPGGEKHVAMTRILHRTTPDEMMNEIPTFRADPLQPECDKWCWFPVADRANAVQQFMDAAEKDPTLVKAPWLLLLETDYVWVRPLPPPGDAYDMKVAGASFAYDYIAPHHPIVAEILKTYCPTCDPNNVPNSGPAPVLARFSDFKAATPLWEDLSLWIETHEHAKKALGWVREMYAWDIGVAANQLNILNQGKPHTPLISQPPHDDALYNATMYHYTWGSIFKNSTGGEIWKFDKRFYVDPKDALKVPLLPMPPPYTEGIVLQDGISVTPKLYEVVRHMLETMNKGIVTLPDLTPGAKATVTQDAAAQGTTAEATATQDAAAQGTTAETTATDGADTQAAAAA